MRSLESPEWQNTTVLEQRDAENLMSDGSARLVRTLLGSGLVDELWLLIHPDVVSLSYQPSER
jgi:riboflavin biosynthesis pyrimidine reductase